MQVLNEQHKLNRVIETSGPPELAEAKKEANKLQSELKVRTKLNQLQSAKVKKSSSTQSIILIPNRSNLEKVFSLKLSRVVFTSIAHS